MTQQTLALDRTSLRVNGWARYADALALGVILLAFVALLLAINPVHEFPQADDWDYARTARTFAAAGVLERSQYAQATVLLHAFVGALVIKLFGFSFTALRLSTLAFALMTLFALYALLREFGFDATRAALGVLTLWVIPEFVYLSFSFMTDIPALGWMTLALWLYVRALTRDDARAALLGSLFAALAFLVRQSGALLPLAFALIVLVRMPRARGLQYWLAGVALPLVVMVAYALAPNGNDLTNWATRDVTFRMTLSRLMASEQWGIFLRRGVQSLLWFGFYLAPLLLALLPAAARGVRAALALPRARQLAAAIMVIVTALVVARMGLRGEWFPYFMREGMRPYLSYIAGDQGALRNDILPQWVFAALTACALLAACALTALAWGYAARRISISAQFVLVLMTLLGLATLFFGVWYERYLLPLALGVIILLLSVSRRAHISSAASAAAIVLIGFFSWALMRDYWSWNEARWRVGRALLAQNIPVEKIDAGYEWDAWYLYPEAEAYVRDTGAPFDYEPWRDVLDPEYLLAFQPIGGYAVIQRVPFASPFGANQFYVLHRQ